MRKEAGGAEQLFFSVHHSLSEKTPPENPPLLCVVL